MKYTDLFLTIVIASFFAMLISQTAKAETIDSYFFDCPLASDAVDCSMA